MELKKQKRREQWKKNKYTNKLCIILPHLCDDIINVILTFLGMDIAYLKNFEKLQIYKNLTFSVRDACKKVKLKLIYFIKQLSVYEMIMFGQFCLQHKLLEELGKYRSYTSYTFYLDEKDDWHYVPMSISILVEKHKEVKQKQIKCSFFNWYVNECQKQTVRFLREGDYKFTKKEACMIQEYICNKTI